MANKSLIDKYLPRYSFNEYHDILVDSPIETVYHAAKHVDLSKSKLIKMLFKLRGLPTKRLKLPDFITDIGFTHIAENVPTENLIGFWARTKIIPITSYDAFINNTVSPRVKVVWNFYLKKRSSTQTLLSTETRVLCIGPVTKMTFGAYWFIIKPFSGAIRKKMLQIIKKDSETIKEVDHNANSAEAKNRAAD